MKVLTLTEQHENHMIAKWCLASSNLEDERTDSSVAQHLFWFEVGASQDQGYDLGCRMVRDEGTVVTYF